MKGLKENKMKTLTLKFDDKTYKAAMGYLQALSSISKGKIIIDPRRAQGAKTQDELGKYFDTKGKFTIAPEHVLQSKGDDRESLLTDCMESWIKTGTGIDYLGGFSLDGHIVYNRGSRYEQRSPKIIIPVFRGTPLPIALKTKGGLRYKVLQLHEKYTTPKKIIEAEVEFAGKKPNGESYTPDDCLEWTLERDSRNLDRERVVRIYLRSGKFHVGGYDYCDGDGCGRSRGVLFNPRRK